MKLSDIESIYCINLDRRPERWEKFSNELNGVFSQEIKRFSAVDGNIDTPPKEWGNRGNGGWGCLQSHWQIIQKEYDDGAESVLIFEDDAYPVRSAEETREILETALSELPNDWEQVYFGQELMFTQSHKPIKYSDHLFIPFNANRTHVYMLSREGMRKALDKCADWPNWRRNWHIDWAYGDLHEKQLINVYCVNPVPFGQDAYDSDVTTTLKNLPRREWSVMNIEDRKIKGGRVLTGTVGWDRLRWDTNDTPFDTDIYSTIYAHAPSKVRIKLDEQCEIFAFHWRKEPSVKPCTPVIDGAELEPIQQMGDCTKIYSLQSGEHTLEFKTEKNWCTHTYWVIRPLSVLPYKDGYGVEILVNGKCPRSCIGCNEEHFMKANCDYSYTTDDAKAFLGSLQRKVRLTISGGEPMLWKECFDVLPLFKDSDKIEYIRISTSQDNYEWLSKLMDYVDKIQFSYRADMGFDIKNPPAYLKSDKVVIWDQRWHYLQPETPVLDAQDCCCRVGSGININVCGQKVFPCVMAQELNLTGRKVEGGNSIPIKNYFSGIESFVPIGNYNACRVCSNNTAYQRVSKKVPTIQE